MGSVGNDPNPWAPYNSNSRDCSQEICTIYCPQFCYFFFPPPPESTHDSTPFSPLIIAVLGVLASAFLLVSYYTVVTRYCKRRPSRAVHAEGQEQMDGLARDSTRAGLDESLIRAIAVCEYKKGGGPAVRANECAVCLGGFHEGVVLRLLPKCGHAFHLGCIDTWLRSHSNCPLCRADVDPRQSQRPAEDLVLAVDGRAHAGDECEDSNGGGDIETRGEEEGARPGRFGRSVSLRVFAEVSGGDDEDLGSRRQVEMKRSASAGGLLMRVVHDEGKIFMLPR